MEQIKSYARLYKVFIKQFLKTLVQSKVDFLVGLFGFFFTQFTGVAFLYLIFQQIPSLKGWTLEQLIFIYGFAQIPRGIDHLFTDNIWLIAWRLVINGQFDRYMLRPMNLFLQIIFEKLQPDALGELLVGSILIILSIKSGVVKVTFLGCCLFIISVIAGAIIYTSVKLFFASLAFWVKISGPFLQVAYESADFSKFPTEIYHRSIRFIITFIIPFAFVAYLPTRYFLGKVALPTDIFIECCIAIIFFIIAYMVFQKGTRIYESSGN